MSACGRSTAKCTASWSPSSATSSRSSGSVGPRRPASTSSRSGWRRRTPANARTRTSCPFLCSNVAAFRRNRRPAMAGGTRPSRKPRSRCSTSMPLCTATTRSGEQPDAAIRRERRFSEQHVTPSAHRRSTRHHKRASGEAVSIACTSLPWNERTMRADGRAMRSAHSRVRHQRPGYWTFTAAGRRRRRSPQSRQNEAGPRTAMAAMLRSDTGSGCGEMMRARTTAVRPLRDTTGRTAS